MLVAGVFGYPGDPPRQANGAWSELRLRGAVGGGVIQLDTSSESAIQAQRGYSGSPVIVTSETRGTQCWGCSRSLAMTAGPGTRMRYPYQSWPRAWPDVVGRLTIPACPYRGLGAFTR